MLTFDEATHTYRIDGEVVPSVTHICRFLNYDVKSDREWLVKEAADRGARVHAATAAMDWGEEPEVEPDIAGYVQAYRRFLKDYQPEWQGIEVSLGTDGCGGFPFAGTIDRFGTVEGAATVLDIKTGSRVNLPYVEAQLVAYSALLWQNSIYSGPVARRCLKLNKDGTYQYIETADDSRTGAFEFCANLHDMLSQKGAYKA